MEHRLERYQDQQDSEFATAEQELEEAPDEMTILHEERRHLGYEIHAIESIVATDDEYSIVTPEHWNERLAECRARLAMVESMLKLAKLKEEYRALDGTKELHCAGLIKCNTRQIAIEAEIRQLEGGAQ